MGICGKSLPFIEDMNRALPSFGTTVWIVRHSGVVGEAALQQKNVAAQQLAPPSSFLTPQEDDKTTNHIYSLATTHVLDLDVFDEGEMANEEETAEHNGDEPVELNDGDVIIEKNATRYTEAEAIMRRAEAALR